MAQVGEFYALATGELPPIPSMDAGQVDQTLDDVARQIEQLFGDALPEDFDVDSAVRTGAGQLMQNVDQAGQLGRGADAGMLDQYPGLVDALDELAQGLMEARSGAQELAGGVRELRNGISQMRAGLAGAGPDLPDLPDASGGMDLDESAVLIEQLEEFEAGLEQLAAGGGELVSGIGDLEDGGRDLTDRLDRSLRRANLDLETIEAIDEQAQRTDEVADGLGLRELHDHYHLAFHPSDPASLAGLALGAVLALTGALELGRRRLIA
jgi:X-X-X-Leu-X-X-Gly heptad repeat protein